MHQKQKKDSIRYRRLSDNEKEFRQGIHIEETAYGTGIDDSSGAGGKDQTAGSQRLGWCEGSL